MNWSRICTSMNSNCLGVRNLIQFNRAFLEKWLWWYATERVTLWRLVIETKYDSLHGVWRSKEVMGSFGVGL